MLSLSEAQQTLWQQALPITGARVVPLAEALGAVAAQPVVAHLAVPPADNSAMDGFALRWSDARLCLPISQRVVAGAVAMPLAANSAARIFTGGEIPPGADTVVMQEDTQIQPDGRLLITQVPPLGANIRPQGQDVAPGQCLVQQGQRLGPVDLALLASQGLTEVMVMRPVRVALVTTGSELVPPGQALAAGQIYNSNSTLISTALRLLNTQVHSYCVPDDGLQTQQLLSTLAGSMDIIITTGGVSTGEEDYVKTSLAALGQVAFWKIALKPGKPFMFGFIGDTPVLGLPGNPVSSFITYILLAKPFVMARQGGRATLPEPRYGALAEPISAGSREEFIRVEHSPAGLRALANQSSGVLRSLQMADGLMRLGAHQTLQRGELAEYWSINELLAP